MSRHPIALTRADVFPAEKTKVFGKIHYDVRVEPRNAREEEQLLAQRIFDAENSKSKLQIISRNKASSITNPGTAGSVSWGGNFIVSVIYSGLTSSPCSRQPFRSIYLSVSLLTGRDRKMQPRPSSPRRATSSRPLVFPRTRFWISSSRASVSISIGP